MKTMTTKLIEMTSSSIFLDVVVFLLSKLVTGPNFMSMSWLVLEVWKISFIKDCREIRKSEIQPSEFSSISEDWDKFGKNFSNKILLNATKGQGYSFYHFWVVKTKPARLGLKLLYELRNDVELKSLGN